MSVTVLYIGGLLFTDTLYYEDLLSFVYRMERDNPHEDTHPTEITT